MHIFYAFGLILFYLLHTKLVWLPSVYYGARIAPGSLLISRSCLQSCSFASVHQIEHLLFSPRSFKKGIISCDMYERIYIFV